MNQTLLCWLRAVPAPLLALEVQRGGMPGPPGAYREGEAFMKRSSLAGSQPGRVLGNLQNFDREVYDLSYWWHQNSHVVLDRSVG